MAEENVFEPNYRVRYRAKIERPLKKGEHELRAVIFDEVLLEFGKAVKNSPAIFNQNRLYIGISYNVTANTKLNLGYVYLVQERASGKALDISNVLWTSLMFDNLFSQFIGRK